MAEEKIEVFKLKVDFDAVLEATVKTKNETDKLKAKYDALRKSDKATTEQVVKAKAAYDSKNKEYRTSQRELEKLNSLQSKEIKTVAEARNALSVVGSQWAKQAKLYGENSKQAEKLKKQKTELTNRLKTLEGQTGDNSRNVGNYTESMKDAISQSGLFGKAQGVVNNVTSAGGPIITFLSTSLGQAKNSFKGAQVNAAGFTKAQIAANVASSALSAGLKILKAALIGTGIGALVVALGALIGYLTKTQRGADFVSKAMAALGTAFDVIIDRVSQFGEGIFKLLSGDITGGLSSLKDSFSGIGDEIKREVGLAWELEEALQNLRDKEIGLIGTQAKRKKQIEELRIAAKDELKPLRERADLLEQAGEIEKKVLDDKLELAREEARIAEEKLALGESTREDIKKTEELKAQVTQLETESLKLQRSIETEKQSLLKRARSEEAAAAKARAAESKKRIDEAIKENKVRLDLYIAQNEGKAQSLQEALEFEESVRDERLAILEEEKRAGEKTAAEYELEKYQIKQEFLKMQADATLAFADKELEVFKDANQTRLEAGQLLTDQLVEQEKQRLDRIAEAERQAALEKLEAAAITREEYNARMDEIDEANRAAKEEKQAELDSQKAEKAAADLANEMELAKGNFFAEQELKAQQLEQKRLAEVQAAEQTGADVSLINKKYANQQKAIEAEKAAFKRDAAAQTFGTLAELIGKESAAGKAAAIAQTTIETYKAATSAYAAMAGIPVVGPAMGAVAAAAAIASGLKSVQKITSTKKPDVPKGAKGLTMSGRSHSEGGEPIYDRYGNALAEIEGGENLYVLNKKASGLINSLSTINQATGGVPLSQATTYAAAGGAINKNVAGSQPGVNYDLLAERLAGAYSALPAPQVAVTEINKGTKNYNEVVNVANF